MNAELKNLRSHYESQLPQVQKLATSQCLLKAIQIAEALEERLSCALHEDHRVTKKEGE